MAVTLITGTSTGIGLATAVALAKAGHDVFATMRNPDRAPALRELAAQDSLPITVLQLDVNDDESVSRVVNSITEARGQIDVLVNNAGLGGLGSVEETPLAVHRQTMETNYFGPLRCIQAVLPGMRERRSGCIVNVTSVLGRIASGGQAAYCASKFALEALSESLAMEVRAHGIRVTIVEPGVTDTPAFKKQEADVLSNSPYPHPLRLRAMFAASLLSPVHASVVGEAIRDIVATDSWQLRYPVAGASGFLQWRESLTDEDHIGYGALDDFAWHDYVRANFGLDVEQLV